MNNMRILKIIISTILIIPIVFIACSGGYVEEEPYVQEEPAAPTEEAIEEPMDEPPEYDEMIERYPNCYFDTEYSVYCYIEGSADEGGANVYFARDETPEPFWVAIDLSMDEDLSTLSSSEDDFIPTRLVANLEVIDPWTDELVSYFDPPIFLNVEYFQEDVENAIQIAAEAGIETIAIEGMTFDDVIRYLVLGFWDENQLKWVSFSASKVNGMGDGTGGILSVEIYEWGDRYIAFGGGGTR